MLINTFIDYVNYTITITYITSINYIHIFVYSFISILVY